MTLYTPKRSFSSINIVPMLDILTILLIFFIVHTEFKHHASVLKLSLPQTHTLAGENAAPQDVLLELGADGQLALGGKLIDTVALAEEVRKLRAEQPQAKLRFAAAEGASMGRLIEILDLLSAAGLSVDEVPLQIQPERK